MDRNTHISDFPTRHNYVLGLWQNHIERILADWVGELAVPIYRAREVTGFTQDDAGVGVELSDGQRVRSDGYVAWVGDRTQAGLADALTTWFGPPACARSSP